MDMDDDEAEANLASALQADQTRIQDFRRWQVTAGTLWEEPQRVLVAIPADDECQQCLFQLRDVGRAFFSGEKLSGKWLKHSDDTQDRLWDKANLEFFL